MTAAKRRSTTDERNEQLTALATLIEQTTTRIAELRNFEGRLATAKSVADGLYDEVDKLCKKAPAESATDFLVGEVNEVIKEISPVAANDVPLQRIKPFVPAGDNPQYRDVLLTLRLLQAGIERLSGHFQEEKQALAKPIPEMRGLHLVLTWLLEGAKATDITPDVIRDEGYPLGTRWFIDDEYRDEKYFDTDRLKHFDVRAHFGQKE